MHAHGRNRPRHHAGSQTVGRMRSQDTRCARSIHIHSHYRLTSRVGSDSLGSISPFSPRRTRGLSGITPRAPQGRGRQRVRINMRPGLAVADLTLLTRESLLQRYFQDKDMGQRAMSEFARATEPREPAWDAEDNTPQPVGGQFKAFMLGKEYGHGMGGTHRIAIRAAVVVRLDNGVTRECFRWFHDDFSERQKQEAMLFLVKGSLPAAGGGCSVKGTCEGLQDWADSDLRTKELHLADGRLLTSHKRVSLVRLAGARTAAAS